MVRIHLLVLHEQTGCIAAAKLVRTAVILNGREASGPLTNSREFKIIAGWCVKSLEAKRGVQANPPAYGPGYPPTCDGPPPKFEPTQ